MSISADGIRRFCVWARGVGGLPLRRRPLSITLRRAEFALASVTLSIASELYSDIAKRTVLPASGSMRV